MAVSLVKRYVSLVKVTGRHAYNYGGYPAVVVAAPTMGARSAVVFRNGELVASARVAPSAGPRHLCAAFDFATLPVESRCIATVATSADCDCVVRLSGDGAWSRGDQSMVAA